MADLVETATITVETRMTQLLGDKTTSKRSSSPSGSGRSPAAKRFLVHLELMFYGFDTVHKILT